MLEMLEEWLEIGFQSVRKLVATFTVSICAYLLTAQESPAQKELARKAQVTALLHSSSVKGDVQGLLDLIVRRFHQAIQSLQKNNEHETASDKAPASDDPMEVESTGDVTGYVGEMQSKIGIAVQFVTSAMHHPQLVYFTPTLTQLLCGVFQIQVTP